VLEGGYALGALARGVAVTLEALRGGDGAAGPAALARLAADEVPVADVAQAARRRLAEWWPQL